MFIFHILLKPFMSQQRKAQERALRSLDAKLCNEFNKGEAA